LAFLLLPVACSNATSGTPDASCYPDSGSAPAPNPNNCVPQGAVGNEKGVGAFCLGEFPCQAGSVGCPVIDGGPTLFCSYPLVVDPQGNHQTFCTASCTVDSDCGSNATCATATGGACPGGQTSCACIPATCRVVDAGSD